MALIEWKEIYENRMVSLDNEYRTLVQQISCLGGALRHKRAEKSLEEILSLLQDYIEKHFQHEDRLLQQYGCPDLPEHREIHQRLRDSVVALKA